MTMQPAANGIHTESLGDSSRFRAYDDLAAKLAALTPAPRDAGALSLLVRRIAEGGRRETPDRIALCSVNGVIGDAWERDRERELEAQISVMQTDVATLIANGQPLTLFGDNLFLDLDLSSGNLPAGSRVRVGGALLEITPKPHDGCRKFRARFGGDALRLVAGKELRHRNLRGIYMRVLEPSDIRLGDPVVVVSRPA